MKTLLVVIVLVLLGAGGYYWFMMQDAPTSLNGTNDPFGATNTNMNPPAGTTGLDASMPPATGTQPTSTGTTAGAVKEFKFTNNGMKFSPATMTVKKGDRVRVTYTNNGGTHDLRIDGYDVGTDVLSNGASETFEFVADEAGTFEFYCSVGNHRAMGMVGSLVVTQ